MAIGEGFSIEDLDGFLGEGFVSGAGEERSLIPIIEVGEGEIDPRYLRGSYSTWQLLHKCPRKYQLKCLNTVQKEDDSTNVTFAFGHAVGTGVAELACGASWNETLMKVFLAWDVDYLAENEKQKKSFAHAVFALEIFRDRLASGYLEEYEVAKYQDKPAIELSFRLSIPGRYGTYTYRGYVDVVLRNKHTRELVVLENKTSSGSWVNHYMYKNSSQALGYAVALDAIDGEAASYEVFYNIYMTKLYRYEDFPFPKSYQQKALFLRDLLWDVQTIETLVEQEGNYGIWPMRGESCTDFGRVCEYMDVCSLDTRNVMLPLREDMLGEDKEYDIEVDIQDII